MVRGNWMESLRLGYPRRKYSQYLAVALFELLGFISHYVINGDQFRYLQD